MGLATTGNEDVALGHVRNYESNHIFSSPFFPG